MAALFALVLFLLREQDGTPARLVDATPGSSGPPSGVHPGQLARDFEALDLEGRPVRLSDLRGRPVVINFWATWCTSCLVEMPVLEQQRKAHQAEGLVIVAVNVGEGVEAARSFIDELQVFDFVIAMDPDLTIADAYSVRGLPHSVFIDSNGVIQAEYRGQLDEQIMAEYVQAALDAVPGAEAPRRLRIVTTVPREHVLEVMPAEGVPGEVRFVSRRFRCDDDYCASPILERVVASDAVSQAQLRSDELPPALAVSFDAGAVEFDDVVALVVEALQAHPDPLYTRALEVRYPEG